MADAIVVTTSRQAGPEQMQLARAIAERLELPFVARTGAVADLNARAVLVVTRERLVVETRAGQLYFHPGMAKPRIRSLERGDVDVMVAAMQLEPGDEVLDCTLGLGADAIVSSYVVGSEGRVVGVEGVPVLAEVVRVGLSEYDPEHAAMQAAMRRIEVVAADHAAYLRTLPDKSFDVVYFDPLFREPVQQSVHMRPWRELGVAKPLTRDVVDEARRVARRRVVIKERHGSDVFAELGVENAVGGRKSRVAYGVIDVKLGPPEGHSGAAEETTTGGTGVGVGERL